MKKRSRYHLLQEESDGWSQWKNPTEDYRIACCDCGLVHLWQFRVQQHNKKDFSVMFRLRRDNRATAQRRLWMKVHESVKKI